MKTPKVPGMIVTKRSLIDKANTTTLIAAGIAAFLVVFSLVSGKALVSQMMYQNRVISAKKETKNQIEANLEAREKLTEAYRIFVGNGTNIINGNSAGTGDKDGTNAEIIIDALPSKYDIPALVASLEKLSTSQGVKLTNINGPEAEESGSSEPTAEPKPTEIPFEVTVEGTYPQIQNLISVFELSIRPVKIQNMHIRTSDQGLKADIDATTYYQPEKKLELTKKVVK